MLLDAFPLVPVDDRPGIFDEARFRPNATRDAPESWHRPGTEIPLRGRAVEGVAKKVHMVSLNGLLLNRSSTWPRKLMLSLRPVRDGSGLAASYEAHLLGSSWKAHRPANAGHQHHSLRGPAPPPTHSPCALCGYWHEDTAQGCRTHHAIRRRTARSEAHERPA